MPSLPSVKKSLQASGVLTLSLVLLSYANVATAANILFGYVGSAYEADGQQLASYVAGTGANVTERRLDLTYIDDFSGFDQIWIYDLSPNPDDSFTHNQNYFGISNWFNSRNNETQNIIADTRIISSGSNWLGYRPPGSPMSSEEAWIQNYAYQLDIRGGGLVLGTDHSTAFTRGINTINTMIGIAEFAGYQYSSPFQSVVDPSSDLYIPGLDACVASFAPGSQCVNDNASSSFAPVNLQANGMLFVPAAFGANTVQPTISYSFNNTSLITCGGLGQQACVVATPEPESLFLFSFSIALVGLSRKRKLTNLTNKLPA